MKLTHEEREQLAMLNDAQHRAQVEFDQTTAVILAREGNTLYGYALMR